MARIRSVHPGLYTDESWASVSIHARWLGVGLWTLCDDFGVFEWKPLQIKMQLFPADNADVPALLSELQAADIVRLFEHGGKRYGLAKNFCKYQRPRKPKACHPLPDEHHGFVAKGAPAPRDDDDAEDQSVQQKSELKRVQERRVPQMSELRPQMEDGGDNMEEEVETSNDVSSAQARTKAERQSKKGSRLSPDWQPLEADWQEAARMGFSQQQAQREFDRFRDYWTAKPGQGGVKLDWTATLRNWLRTSADRLGVVPAKETTTGPPIPQFANEEERRKWWFSRFDEEVA